jgi:hypothetical protein
MAGSASPTVDRVQPQTPASSRFALIQDRNPNGLVSRQGPFFFAGNPPPELLSADSWLPAAFSAPVKSPSLPDPRLICFKPRFPLTATPFHTAFRAACSYRGDPVPQPASFILLSCFSFSAHPRFLKRAPLPNHPQSRFSCTFPLFRAERLRLLKKEIFR